ncbi:MAG: ATP synthase F0 subunit B [Rubrivivax sp.]|nr:ATP synthase F0 subunit B [Rubrivivax sp.]
MEQVIPNSTFVVQAILFLMSLLIVKTFILKPLSELLKKRNTKIEGQEQEARRLEQEASALDATYLQEIRNARVRSVALRNEVRQRALQREKEIINQGRESAQGMLEQMRKDIAGEVASARVILQQHAEEMAAVFCEKILGRKIQ